MTLYFPLFPLSPIGKTVPSGKNNCTSTVDDELTSAFSALQTNVVSEVDTLLTKLEGVNAGVALNFNAPSKTKYYTT